MPNAQTGTCRFPLITGLLRHREVARLRFYAETLGLDLTHRHDGGIFTRNHMVTVKGRRDDMIRFLRCLGAILAFEGGAPAWVDDAVHALDGEGPDHG